MKTEMYQSHDWFALYVRVNHEIKVASALRGKGFEEFLPLLRSKRRWSDRIKAITAPLFPGYVFCRLDLNNRLPVLITPGVRSIVGNGSVPVPVDEQEIDSLKLIEASRLSAEPCPYLGVGQKVRIDQGSLQGLEGLVMAAGKPYRVVVSVTLLRRSVAVEIDEAWVSPMPTSSLADVHRRDRRTVGGFIA
ncbi:MAG: UpxY family transcription antiterminator [Acidobacteriota bacterium]